MGESGDCLASIYIKVHEEENKRKSIFLAFMDLEKAYNRAFRSVMWIVLHRYGVQDG